MTKYAIQIPFDGETLYVTEGDTKFQLRVKLFDTREEAEQHAQSWGEHAEVVEYKGDSALL